MISRILRHMALPALLFACATHLGAEVNQNGRMAPDLIWEEREPVTAPKHFTIRDVAPATPNLGGFYWPRTRGLRVENRGPDPLCWQPSIESVDDLDCTSRAATIIPAGEFKSFSPMAIQDFVADSVGASSLMTFTAQY